MKRYTYIIVSALVLTLTMLSAAWAVETKEEKGLQKESSEIDATASTEKGGAVVVQRLEKEFGVTDAQIQALRDQKLGFGEIAIVFSLAQKMTGGITDANISQIMALREGPPVMGWGEIAKKLGFKLGPTISAVMKVNKEAGKDLGREEKGENERTGKLGLHDEMTEHEGLSGMSHGKGR
jgi:hypothetical protein